MQKVSITSDASLWAELAKRRHENFCSPFLRVASVESTRIYEKPVAKKIKDTPKFHVNRSKVKVTMPINAATHRPPNGKANELQT